MPSNDPEQLTLFDPSPLYAPRGRPLISEEKVAAAVETPSLDTKRVSSLVEDARVAVRDENALLAEECLDRILDLLKDA